MKSQNDKYYGDEHITDKPQKYMVKLSEVIHYEIEVEAMDEEEAIEEAWDKVSEDYNGNYVVNQTGFQVDKVYISDPERNYNFSYGGTE